MTAFVDCASTPRTMFVQRSPFSYIERRTLNVARVGVLLVHLGTPSDATPQAVRQFLKEFLSDPYVIRVPKIIWWPILHGFILRTRPQKIASLYRSIWLKEGSPLLVVANRQKQKLQEAFLDKDKVCLIPPLPLSGEGWGEGFIIVEIAMRYGTPSIEDALSVFSTRGVNTLVILPLFPQYSETTTASIFSEIQKTLSELNFLPQTHWITHYSAESVYIEALAESVREHWARFGQGERLLISFHGIPWAYHKKGDPYYFECKETAALLIRVLNLQSSEWGLAFQSRFGWGKWLTPKTQDVLIQWAREGVSRVDVLTPGFSTDCLETLEEINIRGRKAFLNNGGRDFRLISPLNDSEKHIEMMKSLICDTGSPV